MDAAFVCGQGLKVQHIVLSALTPYLFLMFISFLILLMLWPSSERAKCRPYLCILLSIPCSRNYYLLVIS